jgi:signal transduction histidine kinase
MLLCLLGLLVMQGYLVYQEFRRQQEYLSRQVDDLFAQAVAVEKQTRVEHLVDRFLADLTNPQLVRIAARKDADNERTVFDLFDAATGGLEASVTFENLSLVTDTLTDTARQLFLARLTRSVREDFADENISFWTDSLGVRSQRNFRNTPVDTATLRTAFRHRLDSMGIGSTFTLTVDTALVAAPAANSWRSIRTTPRTLFAASWIGPQQARATLANPGYAVFRRSLFTIGGSAAVLLLTLLSFHLLFATILRQKKLAELKDDFIDNVTHELQTPIAALRLAIDSLRGFAVSDRQARFTSYLAIATTELNRLAELVDGILLRSTAAETESLPREPVDLVILLRQAAERHRLSATKPVAIHLPDRATYVVHSSPFHLNTILDNVLQNAIRYSAEAGVRIDIRLEPTDSGFLLAIADDGWGIAPEDRRKVFEKFYRSADTDRNYTVKGLGIGLYHVRQCVEALGGRIRLRDNRPRGTVVEIRLPERGPDHPDY